MVKNAILSPLFLMMGFVLIPLTAQAKCQGQHISAMTVRGQSLAPLLKEGQKVSVYVPSCNSIKRGDLVIFKTSAHPQTPVIKRVTGVAGDVLAIASDGVIMVNGNPALTPDGMPYIATGRSFKILSLYKGAIPKDRYLVIGNKGTLDSSRIGLVSRDQITGVVKKADDP